MLQSIKNYYELTKPRLIYGNLITVLGGAFLGAHGHPRVTEVLVAILGVGLVMAAGCVVNNVIDSDIDRLMIRTKDRPLAKKMVDPARALMFAVILLLAGSGMLTHFQMVAARNVVLVGFLVYTCAYTLYFKRKSRLGTVVGAIAGATPPLAGAAAMSGVVDTAGASVFLMLFFWQIPHAIAIGLYRRSDYVTAKIPVLPAYASAARVKFDSLAFATLYLISCAIPYWAGYVRLDFLFLTTILSTGWILVIADKLPSEDPLAGKKIFRFSLLVIMGTFLGLVFLAK